MLAAVGPFAIERQLASTQVVDGQAAVRIYNTNTDKIILARFPVAGAVPHLSGDFLIDGVAGTAARIQLDFQQPGGSRTGKLLPTGTVIDHLSSSTVSGFESEPIDATIMDCGNPCVFLRASDLKMDPTTLPADLEKSPDLMKRLEEIRRAGLVLMGLATDLEDARKVKSIPKVIVVSRPTNHRLISDEEQLSTSVDLTTRTISSGDPHRAIPITAALCVAVAAQVDGTVVHEICPAQFALPGHLVIGHPSGTIAVGAEVSKDPWLAKTASILRTARKLFDGRVYWD